MLELDCHLTHDGHVVVSHDENLLRQTGHDVTISSLKLQVGGQILHGHWLGQGHEVRRGFHAGVFWIILLGVKHVQLAITFTFNINIPLYFRLVICTS